MNTQHALLFNSIAQARAHNSTLATQLPHAEDDNTLVLLITAQSNINLSQLATKAENLIVIVQEHVSAIITDAAPSDAHEQAIRFILAPYAQLDYQYHHITAASTSSVTHTAQLAAGSTLTYHAVLASSSIQSNHTLTVTLAESAHAIVKGAYLAGDTQQLRIRTTQKHVGKKSESNLLFKGIVTDAALAAFTGTIRIEQSAAYSCADQQNKNILLGQSARAESIPLLEVLTHEVQCGHGSAVGQLDEQQLQYLMMRGITAYDAQQLLLAAFIADFDIPFLNSILVKRINKLGI